jgi:hypothetical protein
MPVESYQRRWRTGLRVWGGGRRDIQALERFSLECTVSTDHLQATTEAGWHEPVHWYANRSKSEYLCMTCALRCILPTAGSRRIVRGSQAGDVYNKR